MEKIVEREIDGVLYKARFKGMAYAYAIQDTIAHKHSDYHLTEKLFNEILVSPETDIDDFDDMDALENVRSFLLDVATGNFETSISESRKKQQVKDEWACWRLIFCDIASFDYNTVFNQMTPLEIEKANIALTKVQREIKGQMRK